MLQPATNAPTARRTHASDAPATKARRKVDPDEVKRPIKSVYYNGTKKDDVVHTNSGVWPRWAIMRAVDHLRADHYGADRVEIFNAVTGKLHCVLRMKGREIEVLFRDDPKGKAYADE